MRKDISIQIFNNSNEDLFKEFDVWDFIKEREDFTISHLKIYTINPNFYYHNKIELGGKQYFLWNYISPDDSSMCLIYDFNRHFLAPLNVDVKKSDKWNVQVPSLSSVFVSVAVA